LKMPKGWNHNGGVPASGSTLHISTTGPRVALGHATCWLKFSAATVIPRSSRGNASSGRPSAAGTGGRVAARVVLA
jgi:hypothetical protein